MTDTLHQNLGQYSIVALATILIAMGYIVTIGMVGYNRQKHKISPPAMTGHIELEKAVRVQMNNLENLIFVLPILWIFAFYVSSFWAGVLGLVWLFGRIIYSIGYYKDIQSRVLGSVFYAPASLTLLFGSLWAVITHLFK